VAVARVFSVDSELRYVTYVLPVLWTTLLNSQAQVAGMGRILKVAQEGAQLEHSNSRLESILFDSLCESIRIDSFCEQNRPFD